MPLTMAKVGEKNTIKRIGGREETKKFLENLGFVTGSVVTVVSEISGNMILNVKDSRVALGKDLANKLMILGGKTMTLREVTPGSTVKVTKLTGEGPVKRRIMDMGITKGVDIFVRKVAPLGDPVEVTVRGYELSLRKADAEMIEVQ